MVRPTCILNTVPSFNTRTLFSVRLSSITYASDVSRNTMPCTCASSPLPFTEFVVLLLLFAVLLVGFLLGRLAFLLNTVVSHPTKCKVLPTIRFNRASFNPCVACSKYVNQGWCSINSTVRYFNGGRAATGEEGGRFLLFDAGAVVVDDVAAVAAVEGNGTLEDPRAGRTTGNIRYAYKSWSVSLSWRTAF